MCDATVDHTRDNFVVVVVRSKVGSTTVVAVVRNIVVLVADCGDVGIVAAGAHFDHTSVVDHPPAAAKIVAVKFLQLLDAEFSGNYAGS